MIWGRYEEFNCVPLIYKIKNDAPFRLAHRYPVTLDPTRRVQAGRLTLRCRYRCRPLQLTASTGLTTLLRILCCLIISCPTDVAVA